MGGNNPALGTFCTYLGASALPLLPICLEVTLGTHLASAKSCPSLSWFRGWTGVSSAQGRVPVVRCSKRADGEGRLSLSSLLAVQGRLSGTAVLGAECSRLGAMVLGLWQPGGRGGGARVQSPA